MKKLFYQKLKIFGLILLLFLLGAILYTILFAPGNNITFEGFTYVLAFCGIALLLNGWKYLIGGIIINLLFFYKVKIPIFIYFVIAAGIYILGYYLIRMPREPLNDIEEWTIFIYFLFTTLLYTYLEYKLSERWVEDN